MGVQLRRPEIVKVLLGQWSATGEPEERPLLGATICPAARACTGQQVWVVSCLGKGQCTCLGWVCFRSPQPDPVDAILETDITYFQSI